MRERQRNSELAVPRSWNMLANGFPGISRNSQAKSSSEPATKWGCDADTIQTKAAEINTDKMAKNSFPLMLKV
jgi:hypothetical protein